MPSPATQDTARLTVGVCTVHFLHDMLGHVAKAQQPMIAAAIRGVFQAANLEEARERLAEVLERLAGPAPKVAGLAGDG